MTLNESMASTKKSFGQTQRWNTECTKLVMSKRLEENFDANVNVHIVIGWENTSLWSWDCDLFFRRHGALSLNHMYVLHQVQFSSAICENVAPKVPLKLSYRSRLMVTSSIMVQECLFLVVFTNQCLWKLRPQVYACCIRRGGSKKFHQTPLPINFPSIPCWWPHCLVRYLAHALCVK